MDPRPLKYVAPTSTEESLAYAPEPVVIYDLPSGGGGGGGAVNSVNGKTGTVVLNSADVGAANESDVAAFVQTVGTAFTNFENDLDTKASTAYVNDEIATRASATDLDNVFSIATNAQTLAIDAVPKTRTISGKPLSANITLDKVDIGLSSVDNISAANMPVSTAQQTALNLKADTVDVVPNTRTVAGKALSANVTLVKADVGLGSVDNTSDASKPVSTATQTALNGKAATVHTHVASDITDSTSLGRSILSAASITAARAALGIVVSSTDPGGADGTLWFRTP